MPWPAGQQVLHTTHGRSRRWRAHVCDAGLDNVGVTALTRHKGSPIRLSHDTQGTQHADSVGEPRLRPIPPARLPPAHLPPMADVLSPPLEPSSREIQPIRHAAPATQRPPRARVRASGYVMIFMMRSSSSGSDSS